MLQELSFRYVTRKEICHLRGCSISKQYADEAAGLFPKGERHGMRMVRWRSDVIAKFLEDLSLKSEEVSERLLEKSRKIGRDGAKAKKQKAKKQRQVLAASPA